MTTLAIDPRSAADLSESQTSVSFPNELMERVRLQRIRAERLHAMALTLRKKAWAQQEKAWAGKLRSRALRDWSRAIRADRPSLVLSSDTTVRWIEVVGKLGGRPVWARWEGGRLFGDSRLLTHARLLVDLGTVFKNETPRALVRATLAGPPPAVMLTLAHACDHVTSVDFEGVAQAR